MRAHFGLPEPPLDRVALAVGSFDGLHLGHQAVLQELRTQAARRDLGRVWITFDPHPRCVLDPANCPAQITTLDERLQLVRELGVDEAIVVAFNRALAGLPAEEFMARVLAALDLRCLVVGYDFALGRARTGNVSWLREHGGSHGYAVEVVAPLQLNGETVHSSAVRRLLTLGELEAANGMLGRQFSLSGLVEPGDQIGRQMGWPTVNLAVPAGKLVPGRGIYAGWARTPGGDFRAAISVGYRPTFDKTELRVEAYLLDFEGDLYQRRVELRFAAWIREEAKFSDRGRLSRQIARDVTETRRLTDAHPLVS